MNYFHQKWVDRSTFEIVEYIDIRHGPFSIKRIIVQPIGKNKYQRRSYDEDVFFIKFVKIKTKNL